MSTQNQESAASPHSAVQSWDVILVKRFVDIYGKQSTYIRHMKMPMPPFNGLSIALPRNGSWGGDDPTTVTEVLVSSDQKIIAWIDDDDWSYEGKINKWTEQDWAEQLEYNLDGWEKLGDGTYCVTQLY